MIPRNRVELLLKPPSGERIFARCFLEEGNLRRTKPKEKISVSNRAQQQRGGAVQDGGDWMEKETLGLLGKMGP
ncbi:hypothetical protein OIU76_026978 [Salix suchowensis]|nr:hypothetical protein OIU76_026978 [Salix suchowensis]